MANPFQSPAATLVLRSGIYALRSALMASAKEGNSPMFRSAMRDWYSSADAYLEIVLASEEIKCRSGCSACCWDNPQGVYEAELAMLETHLHSNLKPALIDDVETFKQISGQFSDPDQLGLMFKKTERPCPFLGPDKRCQVYQDRPMACRSFFSKSKPEWCSPKHKSHHDGLYPVVVWPPVIHEFLRRISVQLNPEGELLSLREGLLSKL